MKHSKICLYIITCLSCSFCVLSSQRAYSFSPLPEEESVKKTSEAPETTESFLKAGKDRPPMLFTDEAGSKEPESPVISLEPKEEETGRETIVSLGESPQQEVAQEQETGIQVETETVQVAPTSSTGFVRAFLNAFARLFTGWFSSSKPRIATLEPVQEQEAERAVTTLLTSADKALTENNYQVALNFLDATQAYGRLITTLENPEASHDVLQDSFDQAYNLLEKLAKNRLSSVDADLITGLAKSIDQQAKTAGITINPAREVKTLLMSDVMGPYAQLERLEKLPSFTSAQRAEAQRLLKEIEAKVQVLKAGENSSPVLLLLKSLLERARELYENIVKKHT